MNTETDVELKAKELVDRFLKNADGVYLRADDKFIYSPEIHNKNAKKCALIAVDEILYALNRMAVKGQEYQVIKDYIKIKEKIKTL